MMGAPFAIRESEAICGKLMAFDFTALPYPIRGYWASFCWPTSLGTPRPPHPNPLPHMGEREIRLPDAKVVPDCACFTQTCPIAAGGRVFGVCRARRAGGRAGGRCLRGSALIPRGCGEFAWRVPRLPRHAGDARDLDAVAFVGAAARRSCGGRRSGRSIRARRR